jgi:hypothetical protein
MSQPAFSQKQLEAMRAYDQAKSQEKKVIEEPVGETEMGEPEGQPEQKGLTPKQIEAMKIYDSQRGAIQQKKNESMWETLKEWGKTAARGFAKIGQGIGNTAAMTDIGNTRQGAASAKTNKELMQMALNTILPQTENKNINPKVQEFLDETAETFGEILPMALTGGAGSLAATLGKDVLAAAGGSAARQFVEGLGGGSKTQAAVKAGIMLLISMFNPSAGAKLKDALYEDAQAMISKTPKSAAKPTTQLAEDALTKSAFGYEKMTPKLAEDIVEQGSQASEIANPKLLKAILRNKPTKYRTPPPRNTHRALKGVPEGYEMVSPRIADAKKYAPKIPSLNESGLGSEIPSYKIPKPILEDLKKIADVSGKNQVLLHEEPARDLVREFFKPLEKASGRIDPVELIRFKRNINNFRNKLWADPNLKGIRKAVKQNVDALAKKADALINDYGKINPAFLEPWKRAEAIHQATKWGEEIAGGIEHLTKYTVPAAFIGGPTKGVQALIGKKVLKEGAKGAASLAGSFRNKDLMKIAIDYGVKGLDLPSLEELMKKSEEEKPKKKKG